MLDKYLISDDETEQIYLKRAVKYYDVICNGTEYEEEELNELAYLSEDDKKFLKNYIYDMVDPVVVAVARYHSGRHVCTKYDELYAELSYIVCTNLHRYNNNRYYNGKKDSKLSTFINIYANEAIAECNRKDRGVSKRLGDFIRIYNKACAAASNDLGKPIVEIGLEVIVGYMNKLGAEQYTIERVKKLLERVYLFEHIETLDENSAVSNQCEILMFDYQLEKEIRCLVESWRTLKKFIFLQNYEFCAPEYRVKADTLCSNKKFILLCENDNIGCKQVALIDVDGKLVKKVNIKFVENIRKMCRKRFVNLFSKYEYTIDDIRGHLDFLGEYWDDIETLLNSFTDV